MTREDKFNTLVPTINALTKYLNYSLVQCRNSKIPIDEVYLDNSDLNRLAISFIQLNMVLLKENIIENKGSLVYESKIYEDMLYQCMTLIASPNKDGTFTLSTKTGTTKTGTKEQLFAYIRNKIAHGCYYYNDTAKTIVLDSDVGDIEININLFIQFYNLLIPMLAGIYKENEYTRKILINKTERLRTKVLKTEKEVDEFLKLFTYKKFTLTSKDGSIIPIDIKIDLEIEIKNILNLQNNKENYKYKEQEVIKLFNEKGYYLKIENKKIKDKELISKIKTGLLNLKIDEENDSLDYLNYEYGELISKIIEPKYTKNGLVKGNFFNLEVLKQLIMLDSKNRILQYGNRKDDLNLIKYSQLYFAEMLLSISLSKFISLYCYPFDDIYKKDNNYHLYRDDIFDFSKLDLTGFNPDINTSKYEKKGENEEEIKLKSLENTKNKIEQKQKDLMKNINNISKKIDMKPELNSKLEMLKEQLKKVNYSLAVAYDEYYESKVYLEEIKIDYMKNSKYFENLSIIEGMRNAIAHGNVRIINIGAVKNPFDLKIEFTNIYQGKECFKMTISLYDLELLFDEDNVNAINDFINNNKKQKVLKK